MPGLRIESLYGREIARDLDALADLRCAVFRDWPYLYEGSRAYEAKYLQVYVDCPRALCVLVWDGDDCIGASTVIPLADAPLDMQQPFIDAGMDLSRIDYFGESVLLPEYRGRGLGVKFFELREAHARALGLPVCAFCAVQRPDDHPLKPTDFVPNDAFWTRRGYRKEAALQTTLDWPDIGEAQSTRKPMTFWLREIR
ncbi:MAG TPA: GNAT family N-acetyltransferase [Fontimonas sp.]